MKQKQILSALLLAGTMILSPSLVGQEEAKAQRKIQPTEEVDAMIKEVLGQVYTEVGHIEETLWFEMEPFAEEYVNILLKAKEMSDGSESTQIVLEAWRKFSAIIESMLDEGHLRVRSAYRAERDVWLQQIEAQFPAAMDSARSELNRMSSSESVKSVKIEYK